MRAFAPRRPGLRQPRRGRAPAAAPRTAARPCRPSSSPMSTTTRRRGPARSSARSPSSGLRRGGQFLARLWDVDGSPVIARSDVFPARTRLPLSGRPRPSRRHGPARVARPLTAGAGTTRAAPKYSQAGMGGAGFRPAPSHRRSDALGVGAVRIESSVTSVTWIPSEAIKGMPKLPFEIGLAHYDEPPPDVIEDLDALRDADAFREANEAAAGSRSRTARSSTRHEGRGLIGVTQMKLGPETMAFPAVKFPLIQPEPEVGPGWVRFVQTAGGRMGLPAPRRVRGKPYFQVNSASAWTTLQLIVYADGTAEGLAHRREPVPAPLDLRPRGPARREVGDDRLREVVPRVVRREHAVGRGGHARVRDRGRVGAGARSVPFGDGPREKLRGAGSRRATRSSSRARRGTTSSCCWTACSTSRSTARRSSRRSGRARCSASAPRSKAARAPRRCARSRRAGSRSSSPTQVSKYELTELSLPRAAARRPRQAATPVGQSTRSGSRKRTPPLPVLKACGTSPWAHARRSPYGDDEHEGGARPYPRLPRERRSHDPSCGFSRRRSGSRSLRSRSSR